MHHDRPPDDRRRPGQRDVQDDAIAADAAAVLLADVRALIARVGAALAVSHQETARAAEALAHLRIAVASAGGSRRGEHAPADQLIAMYEELRAATEALSRADRRAKHPPEHTVKMLKGLFHPRAASLSVDAARLVEQDVVQWGIDAYYAA